MGSHAVVTGEVTLDKLLILIYVTDVTRILLARTGG